MLNSGHNPAPRRACHQPRTPMILYTLLQNSDVEAIYRTVLRFCNLKTTGSKSLFTNLKVVSPIFFFVSSDTLPDMTTNSIRNDKLKHGKLTIAAVTKN
jgi:hypothetical protein